MPFFLRPLVRRISAQVMQRYVAPQIALHLDYMEAQLGASPWFAGEQFSAADIQISFPIEGAEAADVLGANRPNLSGFLARIRARPAYQRALEKGGPFVLGERIGEE
jgi:glutathione S-transferase